MSSRYSRNRRRSPSSRSSGSSSSRVESRRRQYSSRSPPRRVSRSDKYNPEPNNTIGIFGLNLKTTEEQLSHKFEKYGKIERIKLVLDRDTNVSRGFCFIDYEDVECATRAIKKANGMEIDGRPVRIDYSIVRNGSNGGGDRRNRNVDRVGYGNKRRSKSRSTSYRRRSRSPRRKSRSYDRSGRRN